MGYRIDNPQYFSIIADGTTKQGQFDDPVLFDSIMDAVEYTMNTTPEKSDVGYIDVYLHYDMCAKKYCTFQWKNQGSVSTNGIRISANWYQFVRINSDMVGKSIRKGERISKRGKLKAFSAIIW